MLDDLDAYTQHVVDGVPMRELARRHNTHASTIMRKIRRVEERRDHALYNLYFEKDWKNVQDRLDKLQLLSNRKAIVAVAKDMDMAVVLRGDSRLGTVEALVVSHWLVKGWIKNQSQSSKIEKYSVTQVGLAQLEQQSMEEHATVEPSKPMSKKHRRINNEIPVQALARRRGKDGKNLLSKEQVQAASRLYADFIHSQQPTARPATINWDELSMRVDRTPIGNIIPENWYASNVSTPFEEAMKVMSAGLADILLLVVCYEIGLEQAEKQLGWSARSGKIVLSIALEHLILYYADKKPEMIG